MVRSDIAIWAVMVVLSGMLSLGLPARAAADAAGCTEEGLRYQQLGIKAGSRKDYSESARWLSKAVELCPSYSNYHLLGRANQNTGQYPEALAAYDKAQSMAGDTDQQAMSVARYAQVLNAMGNSIEALPLIQGARELHSNPPRWINDMAIELDDSMSNRRMTADIITRGGLGKKSSGGYLTIAALAPVASAEANTKNPALRRSINYKINFEFDSTRMDDTSMANVRTLAEVLSSNDYSDDKVWLIGHTDKRGDRAYNQQLSERRAQAVSQLLFQYQPSLEGRVFTKGMGEDNLLYEGDTDKVHRNNRRLQVILE